MTLRLYHWEPNANSGKPMLESRRLAWRMALFNDSAMAARRRVFSSTSRVFRRGPPCARRLRPAAAAIRKAWPATRWVQGMVWRERLAERRLIDSIVDMFARSSADVFAAQIEALLQRPDAGGLLEQIRCPALVLCGATRWPSGPSGSSRTARSAIPARTSGRHS